MSSIKRFILAFGMLMLAYSDVFAQANVTDTANTTATAEAGEKLLEKAVTTWVEESARWNDTVTHYKDKLQAYEEELETKIDNADVVGLLGTAADLYTEGQQLEKLFEQLSAIVDGNASLSNTTKE
jgi:hypothetical protein